MAKQVNSSYRFNVTSNNGQLKSWTIDLKSNPPFIGINSSIKVDTEINLKDDDFMLLAAGKLKADQVLVYLFCYVAFFCGATIFVTLKILFYGAVFSYNGSYNGSYFTYR